MAQNPCAPEIPVEALDETLVHALVCSSHLGNKPVDGKCLFKEVSQGRKGGRIEHTYETQTEGLMEG